MATRRFDCARKLGFTIGSAWLVALMLFSPILWTCYSPAFKTEAEAIAYAAHLLAADPVSPSRTSQAVQDRSDYFKHAINSIIVSMGSTLLGLAIAMPAAWAMAFAPRKRPKTC
jgi:sorbitol/mannitol transport system permease protein